MRGGKREGFRKLRVVALRNVRPGLPILDAGIFPLSGLSLGLGLRGKSLSFKVRATVYLVVVDAPYRDLSDSRPIPLVITP